MHASRSFDYDTNVTTPAPAQGRPARRRHVEDHRLTTERSPRATNGRPTSGFSVRSVEGVPGAMLVAVTSVRPGLCVLCGSEDGDQARLRRGHGMHVQPGRLWYFGTSSALGATVFWPAGAPLSRQDGCPVYA
jgi:hypothetical protein